MRVEFYVLPSAIAAERQRLACQLTLKAWRAGMPVFLRCADVAQCQSMDELLWSFKAESFIPHTLSSEGSNAPVVIGTDEPPSQAGGLLLNLDNSLSPHLEQFERIIEIVNQEPELLAACRENFRSYRQRGYDPRRVEL